MHPNTDRYIHHPAYLRLLSALALLSVLSLSAAPAIAAFGFNDVAKRAHALAKQPYKKPDAKPAALLQSIGPKQYRDIRMKADRVLWRNEKLAFELELLHQGDVYTTPVRIHEISDRGVQEFKFSPDLFDYGELNLDARQLATLAYSGFRIRSNAASKSMEEVLQFQGASYFRAHGKNQPYGAFARGMAIDTALNGGERFPHFSEFWIERPSGNDKDIGIYALLDSPNLTGAYRFVLRPGTDTVIEVRARLFVRATPGKLGLAPLTSMFHFGENQARPADDYRPEVHNSDGLSIQGGDGEWLWRPLVNPKRLLVTSFAQNSPVGFGLLQRDRQFSSYEDLGARYEQRPSLWVEPKGKWGEGRIELVQIPTPNESNDNIVAFWNPDASLLPGEAMNIEYRLHWLRDAASRRPPNAWVTQTRWGHGARNRTDNNLSLILDFEGPALKPFDASANLEAAATCDGNGRIVSARPLYNDATGGWRLELLIQRIDANKPVEMRALLRKDNTALTETWSYILPPN